MPGADLSSHARPRPAARRLGPPAAALRAVSCALGLLAAIGAAPAGAAQATALPAPREVSVALTLYADGQSWVRETTALSLLRGEASLGWPRAASSLEPDTFTARFLEGSARVIALTPPRRTPDLPSLLERWVGREVEVVHIADDLREKITRGRLLGVSGGQPLVQVDSSLWVAPPGSLRLPGKPGEALPGPEPASILLSSNSGGKATLEVSYRTPGLSWSAAYRALRSGERLDFEGWITLRNDTEVDFADAAVKLLAGEVRRRKAIFQGLARAQMAPEADFEEAAPPAPVERQPLGTTHLYDLSRPVDLPASGLTRIVWVRRGGIPARLRYRLESRQGSSYGGESGVPPVHPATLLSVGEKSFEEPLPAGVVRVFESDSDGVAQEVGEDEIVHLPAGAPFELRTGQAFDLLAERRQTENRPGGRVGPAELACEIRLRNAARSAATVEVREYFHGRWTIEESSHEPRRLDSRTAEFLVSVPASGEATLTYRASVRD